jgi:hypothetical protein
MLECLAGAGGTAEVRAGISRGPTKARVSDGDLVMDERMRENLISS